MSENWVQIDQGTKVRMKSDLPLFINLVQYKDLNGYFLLKELSAEKDPDHPTRYLVKCMAADKVSPRVSGLMNTFMAGMRDITTTSAGAVRAVKGVVSYRLDFSQGSWSHDRAVGFYFPSNPDHLPNCLNGTLFGSVIKDMIKLWNKTTADERFMSQFEQQKDVMKHMLSEDLWRGTLYKEAFQVVQALEKVQTGRDAVPVPGKKDNDSDDKKQ